MIQNFDLWKLYQVGIKQTYKKKKMENTKLLWHGTRTTDPKMIYEGNEGFDMKFSREGLWGRGLYFAEKASYSKSYAHTEKDGSKGIFLARVNLGEETEIMVNTNETKKLK